MLRRTTNRILLGLVAAAGFTTMAALAAPTALAPAKAKIGAAAPDFKLTDIAGKEYALKDLKGKTVVLEWFCSECPWSGKKSPRGIHSTGQVKTLLADIKKVDPDAVYLLIDSTANMSKADVIEDDTALKAQYKLTAPILVDFDGKVGKSYGAKTTPHMFVIDGKGVLQYSGAFSDRGGTNYVLAAVKAVKAGKAPKPATTKAWGCGVKYKR